MKICAFIGDMYRDYSASIIRNIDNYAKRRGHRVDVYGNCSVPSNNPLQVIFRRFMNTTASFFALILSIRRVFQKN